MAAQADSFSTQMGNWWNNTPGTGGSVPTFGEAAGSMTVGDVAGVGAIFGGINSAIGAFYAVKSMNIQMESQASSYQFKSEMAKINAKGAENAAQSYLFQGQQAGGSVGLRAGHAKSNAKASMAARGIQLGVGNSAEVIASTDLMKTVDMLTVNANAVRNAEGARTQGQNFQTESVLAGISANNLMASAGTMSPFTAMSTNVLGSATTLASAWYADKRLAGLMAKLGT